MRIAPLSLNLALRQFPQNSTGVLTPILRSKEIFTLKAEDGFQDRIVAVCTVTASPTSRLLAGGCLATPTPGRWLSKTGPHLPEVEGL